MDLKKIIMSSLGLAVFFLLMLYVVVPYWNQSGAAVITGTGLTTAAYQGFLIIVMVIFLVGIAYGFYKGLTGD